MSESLLLVRHGVTTSNREGRYMGRSHEPLSSEGRWQARLLARRLANEPIDRIVSSPLRRAQETASIIGQPHGVDIETEPRLNELDLRRWQGLSAAEIAERDPEAWRTWCDDPQHLRLEGIEPLDELRVRVRGWLEAVTHPSPRGAARRVLAVTHDGTVRATVLEALDIPSRHYRSLPVDNASLTILEVAAQRTYLRTLNDTGHLAGAAEPSTAPVASPAEQR